MRCAVVLVLLSAAPGLAQFNLGRRQYGDLQLQGQAQPGFNFCYADITPVPRVARTRYFLNYGFGPRTANNSYSPTARYGYYPNYPRLLLPERVEKHRPSQYEAPPITKTPYHDPYYEDRFWYNLEHGYDVYDYWGW